MERKKSFAHSVKQKLFNLSQKQSEDFQIVLTKYALERILARLAASSYQSDFVLKGAMLFAVWSEGGVSHRATRDIDFLSFGSSDVEDLVGIFREVCSIEIAEDGVEFVSGSIKGERIKAEQEYEGVRVHVLALLEKTRVPLRIDVGFGDVIEPKAEEIEYPTLLNFPRPKIRIYPRETVIAEKFHALVDLGMTNSRLKDFYDLYFLTTNFQIEREVAARAIRATFERRKTAIPAKIPLALTTEFSRDASKKMQWRGFLKRSNLPVDMELESVVEALKDYFEDLLKTLNS
ncbi:MAG: nucleotidyl transferase AbiEii/AbiGii toxin family protein [Acidobacteriota bacterium]|nr:nucleotidyl transferase AbiEii/AbiGii toxin family protein [Acidobacteriota bacterium]